MTLAVKLALNPNTTNHRFSRMHRYTVADGYTSLMHKASDTDILVIAISVFQILKDSGLEKL